MKSVFFRVFLSREKSELPVLSLHPHIYKMHVQTWFRPEPGKILYNPDEDSEKLRRKVITLKFATSIQ